MSSLEKILKEQIDTIIDEFKNATHQPYVSTNLYQEVINCTESVLIQSALQKTNNNQTQAAKLLGLNRSVLCKKIKKINK